MTRILIFRRFFSDGAVIFFILAMPVASLWVVSVIDYSLSAVMSVMRDFHYQVFVALFVAHNGYYSSITGGPILISNFTIIAVYHV